MDSRLRYVIPVALIMLSAPLMAQLTANPSSVTISYTGQRPPGTAVLITPANATGITARISQNINQNGAAVTGASDNPGILAYNISGNTINIGVSSDLTALAKLATFGQNTYQGTVLVSSTSPACADCLTIPVTLAIGGSGQITVTQNGVVVPATGIALNAPLYSYASTTITLSTVSATPITYGITPNTGWLSVSPTGGQFSSSSPVTVTVTANAYSGGVVNGPNAGALNITTPLGNLSVPVTFNVGTSGSGSLTFSAAVGATSSTQYITITGTGTFSLSTTYGSGSNWLVLSPTTGSVNGSTTALAYANAAGLAAGTYTATVSVYVNNSLVQTVPVTFSVGSGTSGTLTFSASPGGSSAAQTITITGNGTYNLYGQYNSGSNWLTFSPANGSVFGSTLASVSANASGLAAGTYTGSILVYVNNGLSQTIPVTFTVGSGTSGTLSFFAPVGGTAATQTFTITGTGTYNLYPQYNSGSNWLILSPTSGSVFSSTIASASANAAGLAAGTYSASIQVYVNNTLTQTIPVTLTVGSGTSGTLTFSAPVGGSAPAQNLTLSGYGSFVLYPQYSSGANWLTLSPSSGSVTGTTNVSVGVNTSGLAAGTYTASIAAYVNGSNVQTFPVTLTLGGSGSTGPLVTPASLTFTIPPRGNQTQQVIINSSGGTAFTANSTGNGVAVTQVGGNTPAVIGISVNANSAGVAQGANSGSVTIVSGALSQTVPVSFNVASGTLLMANPGAIAFVSNGNTATMNISITSTQDSSGGLPFTITNSANFLNLSATSGTTPVTITATLNTSLLAAGFNTGSLTITSQNATDSPLTVPVNVLFNGTSTTNGLTLTPSSISLTGQSGSGTAATQTVSLSGLSGTYFTASANGVYGGQNWLTVSPTSGTSPATLTVTAYPSILPATSTPYSGSITITTSSGTATIPVSFAVSTTGTTAGTLSASPTQLTFNYQNGGAAPGPQTITVNSTGPVSSLLATPVPGAWISTQVNQASSTSATITVSITNPQQFTQSQNGYITISANNATNTLNIPVNLNITNPATLTVNPSSVTFTYQGGTSVPNPATVQVASSNSSTPLQFNVSVSGATWLSVSPSSGTTPAALTLSVNPAGLSAGSYPATVTISSGSSTQTISVTLTVSVVLPTISTVYNGASFLAGAIAPGEIIYIKGTSLGSDPLTKLTLTGGIVNSTLAGTQVLVGGFAAPLIYTSSTEVSAIVPYEIAGQLTSFIQVSYLGQKSNAVNFQVAPTAPGIFTLNSSGTGPGAILNQDGSVNSASNPATVGSEIVVYATGEGATIPIGVDGKLANDSANLPKPILPVTATISGIPAQVAYYGAAPDQVAGLLQVNLIVPAGATSGPVVLTMGNNSSQPGVTVAIR